MRKVLILTTLLILNATLSSIALADIEDDIKIAIVASLKDPDSARFGVLTQVTPDKYCVTVNAKNSMGGYTGNQEAIVVKLNGAWQTVGIHQMTKEVCARAIQAVIP